MLIRVNFSSLYSLADLIFQVSSLINQAQLPTPRGLQHSIAGQIPTPRGTMVATPGGGKGAVPKAMASGQAKNVAQVSVANLTASTAASVPQTVLTSGATKVVNPSLITNPAGQQVITTGSKPIAFSLIQSQGGTKLVESVVSGASPGVFYYLIILYFIRVRICSFGFECVSLF